MRFRRLRHTTAFVRQCDHVETLLALYGAQFAARAINTGEFPMCVRSRQNMSSGADASLVSQITARACPKHQSQVIRADVDAVYAGCGQDVFQVVHAVNSFERSEYDNLVIGVVEVISSTKQQAARWREAPYACGRLSTRSNERCWASIRLLTIGQTLR